MFCVSNMEPVQQTFLAQHFMHWLGMVKGRLNASVMDKGMLCICTSCTRTLDKTLVFNVLACKRVGDQAATLNKSQNKPLTPMCKVGCKHYLSPPHLTWDVAISVTFALLVICIKAISMV